jgi:hypothetical protein
MNEYNLDPRSLSQVEKCGGASGLAVLQYGIQRYQQYHKTKYNILSMAI